MAQFRMQFAIDNDAFISDRDEEIARILDTVAGRLRDGVSAGTVRDINGAKVGDFGIKLDDREVMP